MTTKVNPEVRFGFGWWLNPSDKALCVELQTNYGVEGCAWSSYLESHAGLMPWGVKPGDMFLLWAQQWHYAARALEAGYSVMRVDSDVVFLEDPYPILNGPLMAPFALVSQVGVRVGDLAVHPVFRLHCLLRSVRSVRPYHRMSVSSYGAYNQSRDTCPTMHYLSSE